MDHSEAAAGLAQEAWGDVVGCLAREWDTLTGADLGGIERGLQQVLRKAGGLLVAGLARRRLAASG